MLKLEVKCKRDLDVFNIAGDMQEELNEFTKKIDNKLYLFFKKEYGQKKSYYQKIRDLVKKSNELKFLSNTGHIALSRLVEDPNEATSQIGIKRSHRKRVRIVRGKGKGLLPKRYFKGKTGVHEREDKWFMKRPESIYDFLYEKADKITEKLSNE